jgi:TRAP-type C4-dicarboxylate transport system substrate-binding protein
MKPSQRVALALLLTAATGMVHPQERKPAELRFATGASQMSVWGQQLERLAQAVEQESAGAVKLQLFPGGQLAAGAELVGQVARGGLDGGSVALPFASALIPEVQLLSLPAYFRSASELDCMIDTVIGPTVAERFAKKGIHLLRWGDYGTVEVAGKRPYRTPADMRGAKAGTYGIRAGSLYWESLGADLTAVTPPELLSALQTGLIDFAPLASLAYVGGGFSKVAPVLTRLEVFVIPEVTLVNKSAWDALSTPQREAVERAVARDPVRKLRQEVRETQARALEAHAKGGGEIVTLAPEQRDAFREVAATIWRRAAQEAGPEGPAFFELMVAGRSKCERSG